MTAGTAIIYMTAGTAIIGGASPTRGIGLGPL